MEDNEADNTASDLALQFIRPLFSSGSLRKKNYPKEKVWGKRVDKEERNSQGKDPKTFEVNSQGRDPTSLGRNCQAGVPSTPLLKC